MLNLKFSNARNLDPQADFFEITLEDEWEGKSMKVFYYKPVGNIDSTNFLFVMHGVNRNADEYRDNWIALAEKHNILVVVPEFSNETFPGSRSYNLGNVLTKNGVQNKKENWSYNLIDFIFEKTKDHFESNHQFYDIFGHSAGTQFVHRFAFFVESPNSRKIISANAGWYTMPSEEAEFPFGLQGIEFSDHQLKTYFEKKMVIQLGDQDIDPNHKFLNTSPDANKQGLHRFQRGLKFYLDALEKSQEIGAEFNWELIVTQKVGHANKSMAIDIAKHLYEIEND